MKIILDTNIYFSALGFGSMLLELVNNCVEKNRIAMYFTDNQCFEH
jgi:predicted nucleic acid-binding protein